MPQTYTDFLFIKKKNDQRNSQSDKATKTCLS